MFRSGKAQNQTQLTYLSLTFNELLQGREGFENCIIVPKLTIAQSDIEVGEAGVGRKVCR